MAFAERAGRKIHYRREGPADAPVLMFANSIGTSLGMWDAQAEALSDRHGILRFDARGHGGSDPDGGAASIDDLADDALAVMDAAGTERVHFVGLSLGGMVAQRLAQTHPQRLLSATCCATGMALTPSSGWEDRAQMALRDGMEPFVAVSLERWFTPAFRASSPDAVAPVVEMLRATNPTSYAACCRVIRDTDLTPGTAKAAVPMLLVAGRQDPATPVAKLEEIRALRPDAQLVVLDPAAHILNVEQPQALAAALVAFIGRLA